MTGRLEALRLPIPVESFARRSATAPTVDWDPSWDAVIAERRKTTRVLPMSSDMSFVVGGDVRTARGDGFGVVPQTRYAPASGFDARWFHLPSPQRDGSEVTVLEATVHTRLEAGAGVEDTALDAVATRIAGSLEQTWNRTPAVTFNGRAHFLRVRWERVTREPAGQGEAYRVVRVGRRPSNPVPEAARENELQVYTDSSAAILHYRVLGHPLGLRDRFREQNDPLRRGTSLLLPLARGRSLTRVGNRIGWWKASRRRPLICPAP